MIDSMEGVGRLSEITVSTGILSADSRRSDLKLIIIDAHSADCVCDCAVIVLR